MTDMNIKREHSHLTAQEPNAVRKRLNTVVYNHRDSAFQPLSRMWKGIYVGYINKVLGGDDNRYRVLAYLFAPSKGKLSSKELTDNQWGALINWVDTYRDDDGWHPSPVFVTEAKQILQLLNAEKEKWMTDLTTWTEKPES
jgi:hypothetical protein